MARPHTRALTKAFRADRIRSTTGKDKIEDEAIENAIEWTTLFRRNWEIYAEFSEQDVVFQKLFCLLSQLCVHYVCIRIVGLS